jgi:hypothetical protein
MFIKQPLVFRILVRAVQPEKEINKINIYKLILVQNLFTKVRKIHISFILSPN